MSDEKSVVLFKRTKAGDGNTPNLPSNPKFGEPFWDSKTKTLYIGDYIHIGNNEYELGWTVAVSQSTVEFHTMNSHTGFPNSLYINVGTKWHKTVYPSGSTTVEGEDIEGAIGFRVMANSYDLDSDMHSVVYNNTSSIKYMHVNKQDFIDHNSEYNSASRLTAANSVPSNKTETGLVLFDISGNIFVDFPDPEDDNLFTQAEPNTYASSNFVIFHKGNHDNGRKFFISGKGTGLKYSSGDDFDKIDSDVYQTYFDNVRIGDIEGFDETMFNEISDSADYKFDGSILYNRFDGMTDLNEWTGTIYNKFSDEDNIFSEFINASENANYIGYIASVSNDVSDENKYAKIGFYKLDYTDSELYGDNPYGDVSNFAGLNYNYLKDGELSISAPNSIGFYVGNNKQVLTDQDPNMYIGEDGRFVIPNRPTLLDNARTVLFTIGENQNTTSGLSGKVLYGFDIIDTGIAESISHKTDLRLGMTSGNINNEPTTSYRSAIIQNIKSESARGLIIDNVISTSSSNNSSLGALIKDISATSNNRALGLVIDVTNEGSYNIPTNHVDSTAFKTALRIRSGVSRFDTNAYFYESSINIKHNGSSGTTVFNVNDSNNESVFSILANGSTNINGELTLNSSLNIENNDISMLLGDFNITTGNIKIDGGILNNLPKNAFTTESNYFSVINVVDNVGGNDVYGLYLHDLKISQTFNFRFQLSFTKQTIRYISKGEYDGQIIYIRSRNGSGFGSDEKGIKFLHQTGSGKTVGSDLYMPVKIPASIDRGASAASPREYIWFSDRQVVAFMYTRKSSVDGFWTVINGGNGGSSDDPNSG